MASRHVNALLTYTIPPAFSSPCCLASSRWRLFRFKRMMYARNWTHRCFFEKKVALAHWRFLCKLRCLFKEVLCFDVLECESASSSLSKSDAVWMNGITGHFHGWLPRFFPGYYLSLCILKCLSRRHNAFTPNSTEEENEVWAASAGLEQVLHLFPLADPPACHPVGLMLEPIGLAVDSSSGGQVPRLFQLCLPLTGQCEKCSAATFPAALFFVCAICVHGDSDVWIKKKGGGRMDLSLW